MGSFKVEEERERERERKRVTCNLTPVTVVVLGCKWPFELVQKCKVNHERCFILLFILN